MNDCFILLAAGKGKRFNSILPKQFVNYKKKPLFIHSIETALKSKMFKSIILVTNRKINTHLSKKVKIIKGGRERYLSSNNALKFIKNKKYNNVFIHDAARPNFSINLLKKLKKNLKTNDAVVPYLRPTSTVKYNSNNKLKNLSRDKVLLTQTPQCFKFKKLYELSKHNNTLITDEASLFIENKKKIKFIKGEEKNIKITTKDDLNYNISKIYYGIGFDVHRLEKNKKLYLGGVYINFHSGLKGHSDGDVIIHSVIDSLLGAMRKADIGTLFPDNKSKYKNIRSTKLLNNIVNLVKINNYSINNIDINLICEKPKVSTIRKKIVKSLSNLLSLDESYINLKGKTVEKIGLIGREKAIACEVICSIIK